MPTTSIYALPYPATTDPADVPLDMQKLATQVALVLGGALAATPPATPVEGQLWAFSPVAGVVWLFRYDAGSASAYKWEFVGGPGWMAEVPGSQGFSSTAFADAGGPSLAVPRAGDYNVDFGATLSHGAPSISVFAGIRRGAAATVNADAVQFYTGVAFQTASLARSLRADALAASAALTMQYKVDSGTGNAERRFLKVTPVRVS